MVAYEGATTQGDTIRSKRVIRKKCMYQILGEIIGKKHNVISRWRFFTFQMITQSARKHSVFAVLVDKASTNENGRNLFHLVYDWRITRPAVQDDHFTYSTSSWCVVRVSDFPAGVGFRPLRHQRCSISLSILYTSKVSVRGRSASRCRTLTMNLLMAILRQQASR